MSYIPKQKCEWFPIMMNRSTEGNVSTMLSGFSISGYRSFGESEVRISDLTRLNVFIGRNNCGKSNILRFLKFLSDRMTESPSQLDPDLEFCRSVGLKKIRYGVYVDDRCFCATAVRQMTHKVSNGHPEIAKRLKAPFWAYFEIGSNRRVQNDVTELTEYIRTTFDGEETNCLTGELCGFTGSSHEVRCARIAERLSMVAHPHPNVHFISAFRKISHQGEDIDSGAGLVGKLRKLQHPGFSQYEQDSRKFHSIQGFVRNVIEEPDARLEVPADPDDVYVVIRDKVLPLDSLGTGIHEIVILAVAVTLKEHSIICLEEPEIHCHPALQKKFAQYLLAETDNQYLIASHSNAFVDIPQSNTYRCWLDNDGFTQCELAVDSSTKSAMLFDLGYRPSDLLQANFVIWVEGPSDRIYIHAWLKAKAPDLREGQDYIVMFYGGRLLSHLSYDEPGDEQAVEDFVRLARLNRSACIVMDSDLEQETDPLRQTKTRVCKEFENSGCLSWVTAGRTIENYIPVESLNKAIAEVHPRRKKVLTWERFADLTKIDCDKTMDKVKVARHVCQSPPDFKNLDLNDKLDSLVACIRAHK